MVNVTLRDKDANEISNIVHTLREQGLTVGADFDFAYHPATWDREFCQSQVKHTVFTFYKEQYATMFALRWAS